MAKLLLLESSSKVDEEQEVSSSQAGRTRSSRQMPHFWVCFEGDAAEEDADVGDEKERVERSKGK